MKYSCYYIIHLGCLMGFTMHFYIIFGTNLLTQSPVPVSVFSLVSVFRRKGISNGVQAEWNLRERDFWNEHDPGDLEYKPGKLRGVQEIGGRANPPRRAPCLVPSSLLPLRTLQVFWIASVPKITLPKVSFRLDSVWYSFSSKHWNGQKNNLRWASG